MIKSDFENFSPKLVLKDKKRYILDELRKKHLVFTPEEWVRQFILNFFKNKFGISNKNFTIERKFSNKIDNRYDLSMIKKSGEVFLLIECKSPYKSLNYTTLQQVENYSYYIKPNFIAITNGISINIWNCETKEEITLEKLKTEIENREI